jgi:C_GCAxxG_C_C family probable redox protein
MLKTINLRQIREEAEELYRSGKFFCSEAIVYTVRKYIDPDMPLNTIAMASGFPVGMGGSQCVCGAVSGGVMCLGHFFGRTEASNEKVKKAMALSKELHNYFQSAHKVLCCRILTQGMELGSSVHMKQCISFTGEIAVKTAEIIARELSLTLDSTTTIA